MADEIPQFAVICSKTDFPHHLCKGVRYKVDPTDKNKDKEVATYWLHPIDHQWCFIGYFGLDCFNTEPIRQWLNRKKGIPDGSVRQRAPERFRQPEQRARVETRVRTESRQRQN